MTWRAWIKRSAWRILPLVVLALGGLAFAMMIATKPELAQRQVTEKIWPVRVVSSSIATVQLDLNFYGEIIAGRQVELRPLVGGSVVSVGPTFQDGGHVAAGDLLIAIDPFDYEATVAESAANLSEARARLRELEAELEAAKAMLERERMAETLRQRDVNRFAELKNRGAASSKSFDDAQMAQISAAERVIERRFSIERLGANLIRQQAVIQKLEVMAQRAARDLDQTRLTAPFAGYLTDIGTEVGKRVSQADRAARLIDSARLEVRFNAGMRQFGELLENGTLIGRMAEVVWRLRDRSHRFTATIARTGSEIDTASGGIAVFASIDGGARMDLLRPGAFVEVHLTGPRYSDVVRLPETAWFDGTVMVVEDGRLVARKTELLRRIGDEILVQGGLADGEAVLTTPIPGAEAGMAVAVVNEGS